jgi:membrane-bound lytic murein transglycosylase D
LFEATFKDAGEDERLVYRRHRIQSGQTLAAIARYYGVTVDELKRMNRMSGAWLRAGGTLLVPQREQLLAPTEPELEEAEATVVALRQESRETRASTLTTPRDSKVTHPAAVAKASTPVHHRVRPGDTWTRVASRYGVEVSALKQWNVSCGRDGLKAGCDLVIYRADARQPVQKASSRVLYQVKQGDTASSIARRYAVDVSELMRSNRLNARAPLMVGQRLEIPRR